ncbi:MAG: hypothetical protein FWD90_01590 [Defluviitaleaceae bacterium]|nr:hypothetical protein [Defluviitaleaceae bacterium]
MKPSIIVYNENRAKIGATYPKRAKQLVINAKARWLDEERNAVVLLPLAFEGRGGTKMNEVRTKKRSLVMDLYRDDEDTILTSSPLDIIRKSKHRTRMLHILFSAILWTSALLVFIAINQAMGYTGFTLNPRDMAGTWLVFVFAALIECAAEIYFSRKELAVLSENIDLRQVNPKNDDMDLRGYRKKLIRKIKVMSSAVIWLPLSIFFFLSGYIFGNWGIVWLVFLLGVLIEVLKAYVNKSTLRVKSSETLHLRH